MRDGSSSPAACSWAGRLRRRLLPGRALIVRPGFNPNSSSLGFDVGFLLGSVLGLSGLTVLGAALLRLRRPRVAGEQVGPALDDRPPAPVEAPAPPGTPTPSGARESG